MAEVTEWHYQDEHVMDGVTYVAGFPPETLTYIRDELVPFNDDIYVITYPKAGKACPITTCL